MRSSPASRPESIRTVAAGAGPFLPAPTRSEEVTPKVAQEPPGVRTLLLDGLRVRSGKQFEGDSSFRVPSPALRRRPLERVQHSLSRHFFQIGPRAEGGAPERGSEVLRQTLGVRHEPSLHELHHEESLFVLHLGRATPTIPLLQVPPHRVPRCHSPLGIDQEDRHFVTRSLRDSRLEFILRFLSGTAANHCRHSSVETRGSKKGAPRLPEQTPQRLAVATAFDVDLRLHQRLPPNSPEIHRFPRR